MKNKPTLQNVQDLELFSHVLPLISEKKAVSADMTFSTEKIVVQAEESVLQAVKLPPVPKRSPTQNAFVSEIPEEPKAFKFPQSSRLGSESLSMREFQPVPRQRSFVFGGELADILFQTERPLFGIVVRKDQKEETPQEFEEPRKLLQQEDSLQKVATQKDDDKAISLRIEGPASKREVISKPVHLPRLNIDTEVTIRLKFWILPDGTIGEVVPLQRGDVRLERAATEYLKGWRFTPVNPNSPEVWGIVPITYKLQ
jgi:TonB family protein